MTKKEKVQFVQETNFVKGFNKLRLDVSSLANGMYFISLPDADGNIIVTGDMGLYSFHFKPENEIMTPGYEGIADKGLNMTKEQRATISTITIELDEVRYEQD